MPENHKTLSVREDDWSRFKEWLAQEADLRVPWTDGFSMLLDEVSETDE